MLNPIQQFFIAAIVSLPNWVFLSGGFVVLVIGVLIGRTYWRQFKTHAVMIELGTRDEQSDFDLVSRDVIRTRQEVTTELASRNLKI